jgi:predicted nuclease of predicted toxin-antitoxin system
VRWLADECVDAGLVSHLRAAGHDVVYMAEIAPAISDVEVLAHARAEDRLLLTEETRISVIWCFVAAGQSRRSCCFASTRQCMN